MLALLPSRALLALSLRPVASMAAFAAAAFASFARSLGGARSGAREGEHAHDAYDDEGDQPEEHAQDSFHA